MERVVVILLIFGGRSCYPAVVNVTSSGFFSFSLTTTPPILVNGVEISKTSLYDNDVYQQYDKNHEMSTDFLINDARCEANQWWCGGVCIHRRKRCFNRGGCHPEYPMPCEKRERCFKGLYIFFFILNFEFTNFSIFAPFIIAEFLKLNLILNILQDTKTNFKSEKV